MLGEIFKMRNIGSCVLLFSIFVFSTAQDQNCDSLGVLLYEDLGCSPVNQLDTKCPERYDCKSFTRSKSYCMLAGKQYNDREQADEVLQGSSCKAGCFCKADADRPKADFTCAILDCAEWLGVPVKPGCYRKYELGKCCSTGEICPSKDVATCEVNGEIFKEGDKFYPKNECTVCVCQKGFNGTLAAPFCKRQICGEQLSKGEQLEKYCAPVYYHRNDDKTKLCCPDSYICPSDSDNKFTNEGANSATSCKFGEQLVKVGEGFSRDVDQFGKVRTAKCECKIPPLLTCTADY